MICWLIGSVAIGIWTVLEMRGEPRASKVMLLVIGGTVAVLWPIVLGVVVMFAAGILLRDLIESDL